MRAVTKMLSAGLLAMAAAVGLLTVPAAAATAAARGNRVDRGPRRASRQEPGSATGPTAGRCPSPAPARTRSRSPAATTAATWAWRGTGRAPRGARPATSSPGRRPTPARRTPTSAKYDSASATGVYWYMGGPGVDPHWNGTTTEAYQWGKLQASWALACDQGQVHPLPGALGRHRAAGIAPAPDNGWNSVYTSPCSGVVRQSGVPAVIDRSVLTGFASYLTVALHVQGRRLLRPDDLAADLRHRPRTPAIPNMYEWTYSAGDPNLSAAPTGWCLHGTSTCAQFFGGQTSSSKYALMWQWSGGGGVTNGVRRLRPDRPGADEVTGSAFWLTRWQCPRAAGRAAATGCPAGWR